MSFRLRWTALFCDEMISLGLILVNPVLQCGTVSDCFWVYVVFLEIPLCFLHLKTKLCPDLGVLPFWPLGCPPISPTSTSIFHSACSAPILLVYGHFSSPFGQMCIPLSALSSSQPLSCSRTRHFPLPLTEGYHPTFSGCLSPSCLSDPAAV